MNKLPELAIVFDTVSFFIDLPLDYPISQSDLLHRAHVPGHLIAAAMRNVAH